MSCITPGSPPFPLKAGWKNFPCKTLNFSWVSFLPERRSTSHMPLQRQGILMEMDWKDSVHSQFWTNLLNSFSPCFGLNPFWLSESINKESRKAKVFLKKSTDIKQLFWNSLVFKEMPTRLFYDVNNLYLQKPGFSNI